jgi:hypothetical protein
LCDPVTLGISALLGGAGALFGGKGGSTPPPAAPPVVNNLAATRDPGADVKAGDGLKPLDATSTPAFTGFAEKRVAGTPLGGLGRSGLGL